MSYSIYSLRKIATGLALVLRADNGGAPRVIGHTARYGRNHFFRVKLRSGALGATFSRVNILRLARRLDARTRRQRSYLAAFARHE